MTGVKGEEAAGTSAPSTNPEVPGVNEVEGVSTVSGRRGAGGRPRRGGYATSFGLETSKLADLTLSMEKVSGLPPTSTTRHFGVLRHVYARSGFYATLPWRKTLNGPW